MSLVTPESNVGLPNNSSSHTSYHLSELSPPHRMLGTYITMKFQKTLIHPGWLDIL